MIIAFVGDNTHNRDAASNDFINGFISIHGEIAVDRFRGEELTTQQLVDSITTSPFLTQKRLVIVRRLMPNKQLAESIEYIVSSIADTTDLVLIEDRLDTRSKATAVLKKLIDTREFNQLDTENLYNWILDYAKTKNVSISYNNAVYLVDRVGPNQQLLSSELNKLALYSANISKESIDKLTAYSPSSSIFAMLDALFSGNLKKALLLYDEQIQQGMDARAILGMIIWQLHSLAIVVSAGNIAGSDIVAKSKLSPFVVRKNQVVAKKINKKRLIDIYNKVLQADRLIKTNKSKPEEVVLTLLAEIS